jgi:hypothetical protein
MPIHDSSPAPWPFKLGDIHKGAHDIDGFAEAIPDAVGLEAYEEAGVVLSLEPPSP